SGESQYVYLVGERISIGFAGIKYNKLNTKIKVSFLHFALNYFCRVSVICQLIFFLHNIHLVLGVVIFIIILNMVDSNEANHNKISQIPEKPELKRNLITEEDPNLSYGRKWEQYGVLIRNDSFNAKETGLLSDGLGGAFITWSDERNGQSEDDIYIQKINMTGAGQWTIDGIPICNETNEQLAPKIVSDGAGGAIIAWEDKRTDNGDIYVQRINSAGLSQWLLNGTAICTESNSQTVQE
ncbi:MAG: hypothetical protein ACTSR8_04260, partial [Promethearchaeota archaeon]